MKNQFSNRSEAGRILSERLSAYANRDDVLVLALPRGGVPVAAEVAKGLNAPLDVFVVRKLGLPGHPELAMGAIASGGVRMFNGEVVNALRIPDELIDAVSATRDVSCIVAGIHRGNLHFFETYKRTIWVDIRNRRTIFRCAGLTMKSNNSSWWKRLLADLRIRKLKVIVI